MTSTKLQKCLAISASTLSALGLMVLAPYAALAQTDGNMQTGVEGSQTNPGSTNGTGQVVAPPVTQVEDESEMIPGSMEADDMDMDADMDSGDMDMDSDDMDMDSDSTITQPRSTTVPSSTTPSNTVPTRAPSTVTPATPAPSNRSPRALW